MKKRNGFTLIELLAVIVILAVIALIVTPIVTGIISEAKTSANARSVEGHIKNVEYAIVQKAFAAGTGDLSVYDIAADASTKTLSSDLKMPANDKVTCKTYQITNGTVINATGCTVSGSWNDTFEYTQGSNATVETPAS